MSRLRFLLPAFSLALSLFALGCSSDDGGSSCSSSSDCPRGLSCQSDGSCGEYACSSSADCLQTGDFQEACMQEGAGGAYDPTAAGLCTDEECRSDRDCGDGQVCLGSICYDGTAGPISCGCREDCPSGEICLRGECSAPVGACGDTCECPIGEVCEGGTCVVGEDDCAGVTCGDGETCVGGDCVSEGACDPPCTGDTVCNPDTLICEAPAGSLCSPCSSNEECGGEGDACIAIGEGQTICGQSCGDTAPCPDGYSCLPVDTRVGSQCIPAGGACTGCLTTPCPSGQFCDPVSTSCNATIDTCGACPSDASCGDGSVCATYGGSDICLFGCEPGDDCGEGFECQSLGGVNACAPTAGGCGGAGCDLTADDCVDPLPVLDEGRCICVGCLENTDCPDGRVCTDGGNCVADGRPCSTTAECDGGYCQGGVCVDCLTPGDCGPDEICIAGSCESCDCDPDERCDSAGNCVEVPDPSECTSDSQCVSIARELGFSGDGAACDSTIGCYTIGVCNGDAGGGAIPGMEDLGFGGTTDPFNAPCPAGTTCAMQLDFLSGSFFTFSCGGCSETDPSTCREGETCAAPLIDILMTGPVCGSGGGGLPLPFP